MSVSNQPKNVKEKEVRFPMLKPLGLIAIKTKGGGNCLFHSLSDQLHGDQSHADEIRAAVVREMRQNPKTYRPFATNTGGQEPRYKTRGGKSAVPAAAIEQELETAWLRYLNEMSKPTKFADNLEVQAFANSFKIDVKIYQEKTKKILYMRAASRDATKVVHLARHDWEHYSSVRCSDGSLEGLPSVPDSSRDDSPIAAEATVQDAITITVKGKKGMQEILTMHEMKRLELWFH